jgi:hypothetical protein
MRSIETPKAARWLLIHFGSSPNNAALVGDLDERYRRGRTPAWYWRQVICTIVLSFLSEIWRHKWLTVRALAIGWSIFLISRYPLSATYQFFFALAAWSRSWRHDWILITAQAVEVLVSGMLSGWLIARLHRPSNRAMVLAYATSAVAVHYGSLLLDLLKGPAYPYNAILFTIVLTGGILIGGGLFSTPEGDSNPHRHHATA